MRRDLFPVGLLLFSYLSLRSSTAVLAFALPWMLTTFTTSSFLSSIVIAVAQIGYIVGGFVGGYLVDKVGASRSIITSGVLGSIAIYTLAKLNMQNPSAIWMMGPLVACISIFDASTATAIDSRIPELASRARLALTKVVAWKSSLGYSVILLAPLLAGVSSVKLGSASALFFSSLSILVGGTLAGVSIANLEAKRSSEKKRESVSHLVGFLPLFKDKVIRILLTASLTIVSMVAASNSVIVPRLIQKFNDDPAFYGLFLSVSALGSVIGTQIFAIIGTTIKTQNLLRCCFACMTLALSLLSCDLAIIIFLIAGLLTGLSASPLLAALSVLLYERADTEIRGRALGALSVSIACFTSFILFIFGWLTDVLGAQSAIIVLTLICFIFLCRAIRPDVKSTSV